MLPTNPQVPSNSNLSNFKKDKGKHPSTKAKRAGAIRTVRTTRIRMRRSIYLKRWIMEKSLKRLEGLITIMDN